MLEGLDAAVSVVDLENDRLLFANRFYRENFGDDSQGHFSLSGDSNNLKTLHEVAEELQESPQEFQPPSCIKSQNLRKCN